MTPGVIIPLAVAAFILLWAALNYNALVRLRNHMRESWSDIDTELKRRYDLIPNLVETVKGYAKHEREVLERVIAARNQALASTGSPESQARDENALIGSLRTLFAVSEAYPDLKANRGFLSLQGELANTENRIQAARRFYNGNVRDLNTRIEVFPSNMIAGLFGFKQAEFFEIDDASVRQVPQVQVSSAPVSEPQP
jgi:LemA protein